MKLTKQWVLAAILTISGACVIACCNKEDSAVVSK